MKRLCALILLCTLVLSLFACGKTTDTDTSDAVVLTNVYVANPVSAPEMLFRCQHS